MSLDTLYILDSNFVKLGIIDTAKSVIWTSRYSECGDFEICIPMSKQIFKYINPEFQDYTISRYIVHDDSDMIGIVDGYKITTAEDDMEYLIITGRCATSLLSRRIVKHSGVFKSETTVIEVLQNIIDNNIGNAAGENRQMEKVHVSTYSGYLKNPTNDKIYSANYQHKNLYKSVVEICSKFDYGIRSKFYEMDNEKYIWIELYQGDDKTENQTDRIQIKFSNQNDNLRKLEYSVSYKDYATRVFVEGDKIESGLGNYLKTVTRPGAKYEGQMLREKFINAHDISATDPTTQKHYDEVTYEKMLIQRGEEELTKSSITKAITGEIATNSIYKYNVDYKIGDVVTIESDYGLKESFRLVEMVECLDENGYTMVPTFKNINMTQGE